MSFGPRIYNLFPLLAGPVEQWGRHLPRIAEMGFDWVYLNPFHYPGFSGSLYAVKDYYLLHPALQGNAESADAVLGDFLRQAESHGLKVMMDLVINHTSKDSLLAGEHPEFFLHDETGALKSPSAIDPADARKVTVWGDLAELDYRPRPERAGLVATWKQLIRHYADLGFHGFRCDAAYKLPTDVWAELITEGRRGKPTLFFAETLGCRLPEMQQLAGAGFDFFFNSAKWWDFRADWLLTQYESFRQVAPSIAFPESHDTPRLVCDLEAAGINDPYRIEASYRLRYLFAAFFSTGLMMPLGYEYRYRRKLDVISTRPEHAEEPVFDLLPFIQAANRLKVASRALSEEGPQTLLTPAWSPVVALLRTDAKDTSRAVALINPSPTEWHEFDVDQIIGRCGADLSVICDTAPGAVQGEWAPGRRMRFSPLSMRVLRS